MTRSAAPSRKRTIWLTAVTAILAFVGLGAWAFASPVGSAPDDDFHLASIWCSLGEREGLCAAGGADNERIVSERLILSSKCYKHEPTQSAQCDVSDEATISTTRGNFEGNYPPVFYSVMGVFATPDIAVSTIIMRLVNAGIFVGAITALLALGRQSERGPVIWAALAGLVPLGMFIIPSVNPSTWAILAGLTVWVATYGFYVASTTQKRIWLGVLAVLLAIMGAGARGDSAVYVAFGAFAAAVLAFSRTRTWAKFSLLPLGIAAIGAFFFLTSSQSTGVAAKAGQISDAAEAAQVAGSSAASESITNGFGGVISNFFDLPWLLVGGTGLTGLGWLDTVFPPIVWVPLTGLLIGAILWGLRFMTLRKGIVVAIAMVALVVMPLYVLWGSQARVGEQVQTRYMLPLLLTLLGLALYGFAKPHLGLSRTQAIVVFATLAATNALALNMNMRRYTVGLGNGSFNLNSETEWWWSMPVQPMTVWFIGAAAITLMLAGLFMLMYPKGVKPGLPIAEQADVIR